MNSIYLPPPTLDIVFIFFYSLGAVDNFDLRDAGVELDDVRADKVRDKSHQMYVSVFEGEEEEI
jgi:hypothetical protein